MGPKRSKPTPWAWLDFILKPGNRYVLGPVKKEYSNHSPMVHQEFDVYIPGRVCDPRAPSHPVLLRGMRISNMVLCLLDRR